MLLRCIIGIVLGTALGIAVVVFIFLPWEARTDPEGFNYAAAPEMLTILVLGAVLGGIIGGLSYLGRRQPAGQPPVRPAGQPPVRPAALPDDTVWPPPPSPPAS